MKKTLLSLLALLVCGLTASALSTKNVWMSPSNDEEPTSETAVLTLVSATSIVEGGAHDVIQKEKGTTVK